MSLRTLARSRFASLLTPVSKTAIPRTTSYGWSRLYSSRRYTPDHEWISVSNGIGTVGISDHAQKKLGDAIFVEVPSAEVGSTVEKKGQIGAVESVKAVSDIYAPVSGKIVEANEELANEPSLINSSPHDKAWICKIKLSDESELKTLMDEKAYTKYTAEDH